MNQTRQQVVVKRSLDLRREMGDKIGTANSLRNMGGAMGGFFDLTDRAFNYWQEAKDIADEMNDRLGIAWNTSLQAANLILKGEFDKAMTLIDEAYPHAVDINDPTVIGFIQILRGILIALRDEDYPKARAFIEEGFPPAATADFRMLVGPFGFVVVACGLGDYQSLGPYITTYVNTPFFNQIGIYVPMFMPCRLAELAAEGEYTRLTELMHGYLDFVISHMGVRFPMQWAKHWGWMTRLRNQLETSLGAEAFNAAWERGSLITMDEMSNELMRFIDEQG